MLDTNWAAETRFYAGGQWISFNLGGCDLCRIPTEEEVPPEIQIALDRVGRQGFTESLWNSEGLPIFRQDVIELWQRSGLTGFQVKPVRIVGWHERPRKPLPENIPTYYQVLTTSKVRLLEPPPKEEELCPGCHRVWYAFPLDLAPLPHGIVVDESSWDGADFFGVRGYVFLFCTRRAAEVTLRAGYNRYTAFIRLSDYMRWEPPKSHPNYREYIEQFLIRKIKDL